jgi:hypothetical protein
VQRKQKFLFRKVAQKIPLRTSALAAFFALVVSFSAELARFSAEAARCSAALRCALTSALVG